MMRLFCCVDAQHEVMLTDPKDVDVCRALLLLQSSNTTFAVRTAKDTRTRNGLGKEYDYYLSA